ncbi:MAG: NAD(P)-dependent oxidoreductase [Candidatus Omnitrophica bacterium]|jgi:UDP-glucose 4-epimerase|nr:NAD(P)-dependent oxidoreductase [Candidatus Omnitrophota bacterium]
MGKHKKQQGALNVLVTGGSGFLGSHIADALTEAGHHVAIFDKKKSAFIKPGQDMIVGDILHPQELSQAMKNMDAVFHLAALADVDEACDNAPDTMKINIIGTTNVLEAARQNNVRRVVFASTIYVYSRTGSFYRVSKHACELLLEAYNERYGLNYTILRFGTLYGTRANSSNSVFRYLQEAFKSGKIEFKGTGQEIREYVHVCDAADICVEVLEDEYKGQTLILTGHHRMKLMELLDIINEILGGKVKIRVNPEKSISHYIQTPYSYMPRIGKKIVMNTYCDLGQGLLEMIDEIDAEKRQDTVIIDPAKE